MPALDQLHAYLRPRLTAWKDRLPTTLMHTAYTGMAAGVLWPLVAAMQGGQWDIAMALGQLLGNVGANLLSDHIKTWKDEASAAQAIDTAPATLRADLDKVLAALEAPRLATEALSTADRAWFERTLKENLQTLGNLTTYQQNGALNVFVQAGATVRDNEFVGRDKIIYNYYQQPHGTPTLSEADFRRVLADYLDWVYKAYGKARLYGLESLPTAQNRPVRGLDDVFVPLTLRRFTAPTREDLEALTSEAGSDVWASARAHLRWAERQHNRTDAPVPLADIFTLPPHLAIVGGAGSGKSTVLAWLAAGLAAHARHSDTLSPVTLPLGKPALIPLIIPLRYFRDYRRLCQTSPDLRLKDARAGTLAGFIGWYLKGRSSALEWSADFFDRLLRGQGCVLMLDGLDEVVSRDDKGQVRQQVENLVNDVYPGNRIIVTARESGYRDNAVFGDDFVRLDVQRLNPDQIQALVRNWCVQLYPDPEVDPRTKQLLAAIGDLNARRAQGDLPPFISSPLLVTMVVSVQWGETELPRERAKLYEACIKVILQAQYLSEDPARKELTDWGGPWEEQRDWLATLALAMHRGGQSGAAVPESFIRETLQAHLSAETLTTWLTAVRHRGGLLEERAELFQFVHLTFQEFLVARHLAKARQAHTPQLAVWVRDPWWREVVMLTYGFAQADHPPFAQTWLEALSVCPPPDRMAGLELAGACVMELERPNARVRATQAQRLAHAMMAGQGEPVERARAGRVLSVLGDPRPGVGVVRDLVPLRVSEAVVRLWGDKPEHIGLPDITWVKVPGVQGFRLQTDEGDKGTYDIAPFYLAQYPVTHAQFQAFVDADDGRHNPRWWAGLAARESDRRAPRAPAFPYANHPRENVRWWDAVAFGRWLSARLGWDDLPADLTLAGLKANTAVRLPTEWEWQWAACPRQPQTKYPWEGDITPDHANCDDTQLGQTSAVGCFPRGATLGGAHDLSGNVWEWCLNEYEKPANVALGGEQRRVVRGGAWDSHSIDARVVDRNGGGPGIHFNFVGFRVVRAPVGLDF